MKLHTTIIAVLLLPIGVLAQINESAYLRMVDMRINSNVVSEQYGITEEQLRNIEGSPYEFKTFLPGSIYKSDEQIATNVPLRYNIFADEIEIKKSFNEEDKNYSSLIKDPEYSIKIKGNVYVFVTKNGSIDESGYYKVITNQKKYNLYKKIEVEFIEEQFAKTNYERDRPARFKKTITYYLVSNNGTFIELPNSKNKLIKTFDSKKIKDFIRKEKLDVKEEKDLIKIVEHYNSIA